MRPCQEGNNAWGLVGGNEPRLASGFRIFELPTEARTGRSTAPVLLALGLRESGVISSPHPRPGARSSRATRHVRDTPEHGSKRIMIHTQKSFRRALQVARGFRLRISFEAANSSGNSFEGRGGGYPREVTRCPPRMIRAPRPDVVAVYMSLRLVAR